MDYNKKSIELHKRNKGKIKIKPKFKLNKKNLSLVYTPGVGAVSKAIAKDKNESWKLTNRSNMVAIVSDGTAVLGYGNLGPEAAMPVMEGKSVIFKEYANIDAIPLCINTTDTEEIIRFCKQIEPSFGGINLEDISAPRCFEILERLENELEIPVFHDDQDGTAIVALAALINACRATNRKIEKQKIVINGAGAAGLAIANLLLIYGIKSIIVLDSEGTLYCAKENLNKNKKNIACKTNGNNIQGKLSEALADADVFIGVSVGNILNREMIKKMNKQPIIFALANPIPEIFPEEAYSEGAILVGTGRSDYPNQINNALVFPGIFKGLLETGTKKVTNELKISAANALAESVKKPCIKKILPNVNEKVAVKAILNSIKKYAKKA